MSQLFTSGGQGIRASASASVLPVKIQVWFPLGARDEAWSLKAFVWQKFYYSEKGTQKASDTDIRRGTESAHHASLI